MVMRNANTVCKACWAAGRWGHDLCDLCRSPQERAKAVYKATRYGASHRKQRQLWKDALAVTPYPCARCGKDITAGDKWHLDHLPQGISRPSHSGCNNRASHTDGNRK